MDVAIYGFTWTWSLANLFEVTLPTISPTKEGRKNRLKTSNQETKVPPGADAFQGFLSLPGSYDMVRKCFLALVAISGSVGWTLWLARDTPMCSCGCTYCACSIYNAYHRCLVVPPAEANHLP